MKQGLAYGYSAKEACSPAAADPARPRPGPYPRPRLESAGHAADLPASAQALRTRPLQVRTPEQVSQRLQAVLTLDQYDQLLQLQADADTYESLRCLAVR